jgi:hypothetical protein
MKNNILVVLVLLGLLVACDTVGGNNDDDNNDDDNTDKKDGIIHFTDVQGDVPAGCLEDYEPFADNGMFLATGAPGGDGLSIFLTDTSYASDTSSYSLAFGQSISKAPEAGDIYLIDKFVPGGTLLEYNCSISDPQLIWVAEAGTLEIESLDGDSATYKLIVDMIPASAPFPSAPVNFTIRFHGTTPLFRSGPAEGE